MPSPVNVTNVVVGNNYTYFNEPVEFSVSFECLADMQDVITWTVTYVGSAESAEHDQILDCAVIGPNRVGTYNFVFLAQPPEVASIPIGELLGVTVILLSCYYKDRKLITIGYYINTEYESPELQDNPPVEPDVTRMVRRILTDRPCVTKYE